MELLMLEDQILRLGVCFYTIKPGTISQSRSQRIEVEQLHEDAMSLDLRRLAGHASYPEY